MSRRLAALALLVSGAGLLLAPVTGAYGDWDAFTAVAEADGLQVSVHVPGGPLNDDVLDAGSPRAQAQLDSLGTSIAFAAAPWPGELLANGSGLASGIVGRPLPTYPLIARSSHPTQAKDNQVVGPVQLTAQSSADSSSSRGTDASSAADTTAEVGRAAGGELTAHATTVVSGLVVGPLVLGRVDARASATRRADGTLLRTSSASVSAARIAGQAVELTARGIAVAGTTVPLSPQDPLLRPLADAGLVIRWVAGQESADGVVSPGVEITLTEPVSLAGSGSSFVRWTIGRSAAHVAVSGRPQPQTEPQPQPTAVAGPVPDGPAAPSLGGPARVLAAPLGTTDAGVPPVALPAGSGSGPAVALRAAEVWPTFYLPLVVAGLLALGSAGALRSWGVRRVWGP